MASGSQCFGDHFSVKGVASGVGTGGGKAVGVEDAACPLEAAAGGEHAAEHAPRAGDGVAEGLKESVVIGDGGIGVGEDDAAGSDRGGDESGSDDTHPHGGGGLVARAGDDGGVVSQSKRGGGSTREAADDFDGFGDGGEERGVEVEAFHKRAGPASARDVEKERAGSVGDVAAERVGEAEADVVLGEQDCTDSAEEPRLMSAEPENFGCGVAGECDVSDKSDEGAATAGEAFDFGTLDGGTLVVPEDGVAEDAALRVEADAAVHLA